MQRFINDDAQLRKGGRKATKYTVEFLKEKILSLVDTEDFCDRFSWDENADDIIMELFNEISTEDDEYDLTIESAWATESSTRYIGESDLVGFHTLENGLTIFGAKVASDWSTILFICFYWDGNRIRMYTPAYGNLVNTDTKTAIGDECSSYEDMDKLLATYRKSGLTEGLNDNVESYDSIDFDNDILTLAYLKKYNLDLDSVVLNYDAIKEDIISIIEVE